MKTVALVSLFAASPALADGYAPVTDRDTFLSVVSGKEIRNGLLGINLSVLPDGRISGRAVRWDVTGTWAWKDGYFCREMDWGGMPIDYNCQLVEVDGNDIRFTVDQGAGQAAEFTLR